MKQTNKFLIGLIGILFLVVLTSGCIGGPSENSFNTTVIPDNISAQAINKTEVNKNYQIHGTVQNNGNNTVPYLVISVNDSSGNINKVLLINIKPKEKKEFNIPLSNAEQYDSYKIIIGDQNYEFSESDIKEILDPVIKNGKGSGNSGISVKGKSYKISTTDQYFFSDLYTITSNESATFFVITNSGNKYVGKWRYVDNGEIVSGYKQYADITVVSWPDMKVIGQHRLYGSEPPVRTYTGGGDIYGDSPNIETWINSL